MRTIYLVTTLLDEEIYPSEEISEVYFQRWGIEVKIRDIKTTMKFEMLRVKTPAMARRTFKMIQIAYNLIKARQAEAIQGEAIELGEIGFKATLDLIDTSLKDFAGLLRHPRRLAATRRDSPRRFLFSRNVCENESSRFGPEDRSQGR